MRNLKETPVVPARAAEWHERYVGGSPERERRIFEKLARDLMLSSPRSPSRTRRITARLLAHATVVPLAAEVDVADRGLGIVRAP